MNESQARRWLQNADPPSVEKSEIEYRSGAGHQLAEECAAGRAKVYLVCGIYDQDYESEDVWPEFTGFLISCQDGKFIGCIDDFVGSAEIQGVINEDRSLQFVKKYRHKVPIQYEYEPPNAGIAQGRYAFIFQGSYQFWGINTYIKMKEVQFDAIT